jgi:hypothetical protein
MKWRHVAFTIAPLVLCIFQWQVVYGQPTLPALTGTAKDGIVLLTWQCQYDGIKAIAVRRSGDSMFNYSIVGYVQQTGKGIQAFADGTAKAGNNYYKLNIVFNSGLNWGSNRCSVFVDSAQVNGRAGNVPDNAALQQFIVQEPADGEDTTNSIHEVSMVFDADSIDAPATGKTAIEPVKHRKVAIAFPEVDMDDLSFLKSRYISVSAITGHVTIAMPAGLKDHKFSLKFFDLQANVVVEIPAISAPVIILDKRNFPSKGRYKFELYRDSVIFEKGSVNIRE